MMRAELRTLALLFAGLMAVSALAQDADYYKAIQKPSPTRMQPAQFKQMEENALRNFSQPDSYEQLATSFGNTTEKVWAVIYGEAYCNLSSDPEQVSRVGSQVYRWYEGSLSRQGNGLSISLTENAQASPKQLPFESLFEQTFLMGAVSVKGDFPPLSIRQLTEIRRNQLALKKLPETGLVRRQEAILSAGHFEAYNYWLFRSARADEFAEWITSHKDQFEAWLDWRSKNKFEVETPDFQRLYLLRQSGRSDAMPSSLMHEAGHVLAVTKQP
jgi:hypothetical protein